MKKFIAEAVVIPAVTAMLPTIERVVRESTEKFLKEFTENALPNLVEAAIKAALPSSLDGLVPDLNQAFKDVLAGNLPALINDLLAVPQNMFRGFLK